VVENGNLHVELGTPRTVRTFLGVPGSVGDELLELEEPHALVAEDSFRDTSPRFLARQICSAG
jgi:hypothetical protein